MQEITKIIVSIGSTVFFSAIFFKLFHFIIMKYIKDIGVKSSSDTIKKFDKLPCKEYGERIAKLEGRLCKK